MTYPEPRDAPPEPFIMDKPWGRFIQYVLNEPVTVKILEIKAGEQPSYQFHAHRSELWVALDEGACVRIDDEIQRPAPMELVFIPQGAKHQLIGEDKDYRILEISFGHFDEEDITRLEDKYGRVSDS
jgi:mannose-6-phosphate isomerase